MKKTWIKVKRGLIEPKHRTQLGIRIWLYLHILDRANWETGTVKEWVDENEADVLEMPVKTLRRQRRQLEEDEYITSKKGQHSQEITIHNWTDPRKYDGEIINQSAQNRLLSTENESAHSPDSPSESSLDSPSDYTAHEDPSLESHTTSHKSNNKRGDRPPSVELCKRIVYRFPHKSLWKTLDRKVGRDFISLLRWGRLLRHWKLNDWNVTNYKGMLEAFSRNDKDNPLDYDSDLSREKYAEGWENR